MKSASAILDCSRRQVQSLVAIPTGQLSFHFYIFIDHSIAPRPGIRLWFYFYFSLNSSSSSSFLKNKI